MQTILGEINTILFDKDGTLLDFHATWDQVLGSALRLVTEGDDDKRLDGAANAVGFDLVTNTILPDAPFVAESNHELSERLRPFVDPDEFNRAIVHFAQDVAVPASGTTALLRRLADESIRLAVVTNDSETQARHHIKQLGWADYFDVIVGYDSGYGVKPGPGPVLGALDLLKSDPATSLMVGDTMHDLKAGRAAGVLTAYIGREPELVDLADIAGSSIVALFESLLAPD